MMLLMMIMIMMILITEEDQEITHRLGVHTLHATALGLHDSPRHHMAPQSNLEIF